MVGERQIVTGFIVLLVQHNAQAVVHTVNCALRQAGIDLSESHGGGAAAQSII